MPDIYQLFLEKFTTFTEIQKLAIPIIKEGKNCIISAPTGNGKTEAALLPVLENLGKNREAPGIRAIYVTPLRALNRDLEKRLVWLCGEMGISMASRHGDTTTTERSKQASAPPSLMITTPETLQNLFFSPRLRHSLQNIKTVIIDEAHELYYNKRGAQLAVALERIEEISGPFQRIGISANIGDPEKVSYFLFGKRPYEIIKVKTPKKLSIKIEMPTIPQRPHPEFAQAFSLDDKSLARIERISDLINTSGASIVFANTRQAVESLGSKLIYLNRLEGTNSIGIHHSSLDKQERIEIENTFKEGKLNAIIATSSLELGIDIGRVDHVIQYGSPKQPDRLIQRIGRGGHREGETSNGHIITSGILESAESASVASAAQSGILENKNIEDCPYDVMINQITAMILEHGKIKTEAVKRIFLRTSTFSNLKNEKFEEALKLGEDLHLFKAVEGELSISSRTRKYFYGNISVIPDSPRFYVKEAVKNRIISTLDEKFVHSYLDQNSTFITKGTPWKVISIEENTIFVEQSQDLESAIPDWEGEDIPVSYEIARKTMNLLNYPSEVSDNLDRNTLKALSVFSEQQRENFVFKEENVIIEELENYIIVYLPLGKLANEYLARIISGLIATSVHDRAYVKSTPYVILIDCRQLMKIPNMQKVFNTLINIDSETMKSFIEKSELFRYKFIQIAKLSGIIDKKAAITKNTANRIVEFYKGTLIYEETIRDLEKNYLDSHTVGNFLGKIRKGTITFETRTTESPLTREILYQALNYREFLSAISPGKEEIAAFEEKFATKEVVILCTFCSLQFSHKINLSENTKLKCKRCGSTMLSIYEEAYVQALKKKQEGKKLSPADRQAYSNAISETGMISAYGDRAIVALLTYGVGTVTASRLLRMVRPDKDKFIKDLIEAQKTFIKNSKFWKTAGK